MAESKIRLRRNPVAREGGVSGKPKGTSTRRPKSVRRNPQSSDNAFFRAEADLWCLSHSDHFLVDASLRPLAVIPRYEWKGRIIGGIAEIVIVGPAEVFGLTVNLPWRTCSTMTSGCFCLTGSMDVPRAYIITLRFISAWDEP